MGEADAAHVIAPHPRLVDLIRDGIQPPGRATVRLRWSARTTRALHAALTADGYDGALAERGHHDIVPKTIPDGTATIADPGGKRSRIPAHHLADRTV